MTINPGLSSICSTNGESVVSLLVITLLRVTVVIVVVHAYILCTYEPHASVIQLTVKSQ